MISFTEETYTVSEGRDSVQVCVELEGDLELPEEVEVRVATSELDTVPDSATG